MRRVALLLFVACAADHKPDRTTPVAASASATATTTASAVAIVDAGPKDWMWELVGGAREAWWRWSNGTCEKWRVDPDRAPAEYVGTVFHADGAIELQLSYDGNPPHLRAPRVVEDRANDAGTNRFDLACAGEEQASWYLDEASCNAAGPAPLVATGCFSAVAADARAKATSALHGEVRRALADAITHAHFVWSGCTKRIVRKRGGKLWLNDTYLYPTEVHWTMHGLELEEQAETNPDYVAPRGGGEVIAIGCCGTTRYVVQSFADGVADVLFNGTKSERWYIDKAPPEACKR